jgi:uncharacterized damage-inducible protein DinB
MRASSLSPMSRMVRAGALVALTLVIAPRLAAAQAAPTPAENAAALRKSYLAALDETQGKFLQLAEAFPAEKYSWRPAPGVRSVGEVFMHVASEYYAWSPRSFGATPSPVVTMTREGFQQFESNATKENVLKHLKEGYAYGKQAVEGVDPATLTGTKKFFGTDATTADIALGMSGDLHEHLGQLIAYARMNGVTPPWSK